MLKCLKNHARDYALCLSVAVLAAGTFSNQVFAQTTSAPGTAPGISSSPGGTTPGVAAPGTNSSTTASPSGTGIGATTAPSGTGATSAPSNTGIGATTEPSSAGTSTGTVAAPSSTGTSTTLAQPSATTGPVGAGAALPANRPLTLTDVVNFALNNNSTVVLARQRLQKANEEIELGYAEARPQIRIDVADTYSSVKTFGANVGGSSQVVTVPGIPVITDQGGGTNGTFIGGGGGGGTITTTGTSTSPTTTAPSTTTTPGSSTTAPGTGTSSISGVGLAVMPAVMQEYTAAANPGTIQPQMAAANAHAEQAHAGSNNNNNNGGQHNNYGGRLSVTQQIDINGLVPTSVDVLKRTRDFYAIDLDRVTNELSLAVKNTFFNLLRAEAAVNVQQQEVNAATENVRIAQAKFTAGTAAEFDVLTAQTNLSNAQQQLISAQNQVNLAQADLNSILGVNLDAPTAIQDNPPPFDLKIDLPGSLRQAVANRPELKQADNNIVIAQRLVKLSGAGLLPSLGLTGAADYSGTGSSGSPRDTYTISADLGLPLYDGGATRSRVRSAKVDLATQLVTRDQLRQSVTLEVRQAYLNIIDAQALAASARQGVAQATDALRLANIRYQNGIGTFLDVTNAQAQLVTAQTNLLNAQYNYETALAQMLRAEGGR